MKADIFALAVIVGYLPCTKFGPDLPWDPIVHPGFIALFYTSLRDDDTTTLSHWQRTEHLQFPRNFSVQFLPCMDYYDCGDTPYLRLFNNSILDFGRNMGFYHDLLLPPSLDGPVGKAKPSIRQETSGAPMLRSGLGSLACVFVFGFLNLLPLPWFALEIFFGFGFTMIAMRLIAKQTDLISDKIRDGFTTSVLFYLAVMICYYAVLLAIPSAFAWVLSPFLTGIALLLPLKYASKTLGWDILPCEKSTGSGLLRNVCQLDLRALRHRQ